MNKRQTEREKRAERMDRDEINEKEKRGEDLWGVDKERRVRGEEKREDS